jgi:DNA-binding GntR family transcriptional regulator
MLTEDTYQAIRRDIMCCVLEPGGQVTELELCARYGVGKAPVRLALSRLGQEGLIRAVPRRGYAIAPVTVRDVEEIYQLRLVLEPAAVKMAIGRESFTRLEALASLEAVPDQRDDLNFLARGLARNRDFHVGIARIAGNERLVASVARLIDDAERVMSLWLSRPADIASGVFREQNDHSAIIRALIAGDGEAAAREMQSIWKRRGTPF